MKRLFSSLGICTMLAFSCNQSKINADELTIRNIRQQFNDAIATHDSTRIDRFCTADYTAISSRNSEIHGIDGEAAALAIEYRTKKEVIYIRTPREIKVFDSWHMASEYGSYTGQWHDMDGLIKVAGTYYAKWHNINSAWRIRVEVFTPLSCTGGKWCEVAPL